MKGAFDVIRDKERMVRGEAVPPNSPQFNGCAERGILMLEVIAFAARLQAKILFRGALDEKIPKYTDDVWAEALNWSCASRKKTAIPVHLGKKNLYELWRGHAPALTLRQFLFVVSPQA